ncbi:MAG: hypothetical protein WD934_04765 [Gemmatimonadales bacterium]
MQMVARACSTLVVIGALFVPYAQPILCEAQMDHAMDGQHPEHAGHPLDSGAPRLEADGMHLPCAPACLTAQIAPPSVGTPDVPTGPQLGPPARVPSRALSAAHAATPPPPKS